MIIKNMRGAPVFVPAQPMNWSLSDQPGKSWLPADVDSQISTVRWIQADSSPTGPFFDDWISGLRSKSPTPREVETEMSHLSRVVEHLPSKVPRGIIFHLSRCGSTLVGQALDVADNVMVLREAACIAKVMEVARSPSQYWSRIGLESLSNLITVFASSCGLPAKRVVVKTGFCAIPCLSAIRVLWPSVPCLFIAREPVAVVVSNVERRAKFWADWYTKPELCPLGMPPCELLGVGRFHEFCAWTIGRMCEEALACLDRNCLLLDYGEISPEVVLRVANYFDLYVPGERHSLLSAIFARDAKHPERPFREDTKLKRRAASHSIVEAVERWAALPYQRLLGSEFRICSGKRQ